MTLPPAVLAATRAAQESIMDATVVVESGPGRYVFDPATGAEVFTPDPPLYDGIGKVQAITQRDSKTVTAGTQSVTIADHVCVLPWHVTDIPPDTRIIITESPDPFLTGKTLTVKGVSGNDMVTARRLLCILNLG